MKQVYEATGKTVDEAIDLACSQNGISLQDAEVQVLEFGSKGFFGFGGKDAKVRLTVEKPDPPEKKAPRPLEKPAESKTQKIEKASLNNTPDEQGQEVSKPPKNSQSKLSSIPMIYNEENIELYKKQALDFLNPIFEKLQVNPECTTTFNEGVLLFSFSGNNLGAIIGRRGETLNALQYLTNLMINRKASEHVRIVLDVEGYRQGREETLIQLAKKMADKAVRSGRRIELEPMNPNERRVVHLALQDDKRVDSSSRGEEPYRRVVISSKKVRRH